MDFHVPWASALYTQLPTLRKRLHPDGICVIHTSWPVATGETASEPVPAQVPVNLVECPGTGFLTVQGIEGGEALILDSAGRVVGTALLEPGEKQTYHLPPGVYHLVDPATGLLLQRGVVLAR